MCFKKMNNNIIDELVSGIYSAGFDASIIGLDDAFESDVFLNQNVNMSDVGESIDRPLLTPPPPPAVGMLNNNKNNNNHDGSSSTSSSNLTTVDNIASIVGPSPQPVQATKGINFKKNKKKENH